MKKLFLLLSISACTSIFISCLDQDDSGFEPNITASNGFYTKGDSIPPASNDSIGDDRDSGGEEGQTPIKP